MVWDVTPRLCCERPSTWVPTRFSYSIETETSSMPTNRRGGFLLTISRDSRRLAAPSVGPSAMRRDVLCPDKVRPAHVGYAARSEEHTSELQSRPHLVCRLLL